MRATIRWVALVLGCSFLLGCNAKTTRNGPDASGSGGSGETSGSGGSTASGGSGGRSSSWGDPSVFDVVRQGGIHKLDLLLVVDNSISMRDKQELLALAIPNLVERFVNPLCVSKDDPGSTAPDGSGNCPNGYEREFNPLDDMHIGVITSSLGGHGGQICTEESPSSLEYDPSWNDAAHLLGTARPDDQLNSFNGQGFLAWDPAGKYQGGQTNSDTLEADFTDHVLAAGDTGCGYEATLEAWYRFLIDPSPPTDIVVEDNGLSAPVRNADGSVAVDSEILAERANFLRPDSAVAIVMFTDENDCSVIDKGTGYLMSTATIEGSQLNLPESTSACDQDPNSPCCRSCGLSEAEPPDGCAELNADAKCTAGRQSNTDSLNLRCYDQKRRFGFDMLYPIERYVDGLTEPQVYDTHNCVEPDDDAVWDIANYTENCPLVESPLFAGGMRDPSAVFLAGIVGVPWQDIATAESLSGSGLVFKTAAEMDADGTWDVVLGDPEKLVPPSDPLMFETPDARSGVNPVTGEALAPADSDDPEANSINGHEYDNSTEDDLQYACIFPLAEPRDCATDAAACNCPEPDLQKNLPLCNPPGGGPAGTIQYYAKAYPGLRHLEVLRDFGQNSIVASVCPKNVDGDDSDPAFGYNPAAASIVSSVSSALQPRCLPRELPTDSEGKTTCTVVEVTRLAANVPPCAERPGRAPVEADSAVDGDARAALESEGYCGPGTAVDCADFEICEIMQLDGDAGVRCLTDVTEVDDGFCYVDADQGIGNSALVSACPDGQQRILRFVGTGLGTPISGSLTLLGCY